MHMERTVSLTKSDLMAAISRFIADNVEGVVAADVCNVIMLTNAAPDQPVIRAILQDKKV